VPQLQHLLEQRVLLLMLVLLEHQFPLVQQELLLMQVVLEHQLQQEALEQQ
jgi:hypothetical protein